MKKLLFCVLVVFFFTNPLVFGASINFDYFLTVRKNADGIWIDMTQFDGGFDGLITKSPGWWDKVFFHFPWESDANSFQLTAAISNGITSFKDGVAYIDKSVEVWLLSDVSPSFDHNSGKFLGELISTSTGVSNLSLTFDNPYSDFWICLTNPQTIGLPGDASQLACWDAKVTPVPNPASLILFGSGLLGLVGIRRKTWSRE